MKREKNIKHNSNSLSSNQSQKLLSRSVSILAPVITLVVLEFALRFFGYGVTMDLFTEYNADNRFLIMNPDVSKKYFTNSEDATHGLAEIFRKEKTPETFRAFVLGASTGIAFPYTSNGSFSRWLKYRLMNEYPDKEIEIINLSLTAVNSYAALDFTKQITAYNPDVVLVYLGHNEYYGALGVGSTSKLGNNIRLVRLLTDLRELRIVQLISNINQSANATEEEQSANENLMVEMAGDKDIAWESEKYKMGIEQFRSNMDEICKILSDENVPTIISTLVSNEKSLKPFISDTTNSELSAEYYFELASVNYNKGDFENAKQQYLRAKELDLLRYRAPEEMNLIIGDLANKYSDVYMADTKQLFIESSDHGIIGDEMLMDHVHPYLYGQGLISDSFYKTLKENKIISDHNWDEMTFSELLEEMPVTTVDSLKGVFLMNLFLKEWPFNRTDISEPNIESSFEAKLANQIVYDGSFWFQAMEELSNYYQQNENWNGALKVAEASILAFPYEENSYAESYRMCLKQNNLKKAEFHLQKAFQLNPGIDKARDLFSLNMDNDNVEKAMTYLNFLIENDKENKAAYSAMEENMELINTLKTTSKNVTDKTESLNALAGIYLKLRYKNATTKYLEMALKEEPNNTESLELLEQAKALPNFYN